ncbi:hypothetical protein CN085_33255 [Sinorhizobium meliloti]|nr:hypothetical protein CN085_33255 [Sinorhizobium meliloti]
MSKGSRRHAFSNNVAARRNRSLPGPAQFQSEALLEAQRQSLSFLTIHYAIFRVQNGNTQPGTLRPMLLPLVDTDLNFRTGA